MVVAGDYSGCTYCGWTGIGRGLSGGFSGGGRDTELVRRGAGRGHVGEPTAGCGDGELSDPAAPKVKWAVKSRRMTMMIAVVMLDLQEYCAGKLGQQ